MRSSVSKAKKRRVKEELYGIGSHFFQFQNRCDANTLKVKLHHVVTIIKAASRNDNLETALTEENSYIYFQLIRQSPCSWQSASSVRCLLPAVYA